MRLILHIGLGKVGSTSIQKFLEQNEAVLFERGFITLNRAEEDLARQMAMAEGSANTHRYFVTKTRIVSEEAFQENQRSFWKRLEVFLAPHKATHQVVASCEYLHSCCNTEEKAKRLQENLSTLFSDVQIVIYCRNQVDLVRSYYAQNVKGSSKITDTYESAAFAEKLKDESWYFDYWQNFSMWENVFGVGKVQVRLAQPDTLKSGNLIEDFVATAGLPMTADELVAKTAIAVNKSPQYRNVQLLRLNNWLRNSMPFLGSVCNALQRQLIHGRQLGGTFPTTLDKQIYHTYDDSNRQMAQHFLGINQNPFTRP